jgi:hypothetical protein
MAEDFRQLTASWSAPAQNAVAVTPANTDLTHECRALFVGTGGDVVLIAKNDSAAVTFANVPDGAILPVRCKQVLDSTSASDILALY